MTDKEAFKIGFLMKCAEEGLTPSQVESRITDSVAIIKKAETNAWDVLKTVTGKAWPLALAAPWVAGGLGGYALSQAGDEMYSVEEAKKREELAEYYRAIDQLKRAERTNHLEF